MRNEILDAIYGRRSVREFSGASITDELLEEVVRAGSWAPSGLNNQPWRFAIVKDPGIKQQLGEQTKYGAIIKAASAAIAVFLDRKAMYHEIKDAQAAGACLQNMLLAAHSVGLGAVWLGEILKNKEKVREILSLPSNLELMAVVALGYPASRDQKSSRKNLDELIVKKT